MSDLPKITQLLIGRAKPVLYLTNSRSPCSYHATYPSHVEAHLWGGRRGLDLVQTQGRELEMPRVPELGAKTVIITSSGPSCLQPAPVFPLRPLAILVGGATFPHQVPHQEGGPARHTKSRHRGCHTQPPGPPDCTQAHTELKARPKGSE